MKNTKVGDKTLGEYWAVAQTPVYIAIGLSVLNFVLLFALGVAGAAFTGIVGLAGLLVWLWLGWRAVKEFKYGLKASAIAGAVGGTVAGVVGAIISIVSVSVLSLGVAEAMGTMGYGYGMAFGAFAGAAIFSVAIAAVIGGLICGAILALVGAFVAQNV